MAKTPTQPLHLQEGDRVVLTQIVTLNLGKLAESEEADNRGWVVVSQQHGPFGTPEQPIWGNPEGAVGVVNGWWKFQAGDRQRGNFWEQKLMPYRDGQTVHLVMDIKQSSSTAGWAKVWMNGKQVLDTNQPVLQPDNYEGVEIRSGVYMGTNDKPLPALRRWGRFSNLGLAFFPGPQASVIKSQGVTLPCEKLD